MKLTNEHIGKKVKRIEDGDDWAIVIAVDDTEIWVKKNASNWTCLNDGWELYEEPKKTVKMWPAIYKFATSTAKWGRSDSLFASEEDARKYFNEYFVQWPAIPNPDGSYDVEVEE